jgi:asparagine synthase (glutamine-hydrolysing)
MCGITGKIHFKNNDHTVIKESINTMNAAISHRGPDDNGVYITDNNKIGLGQQRLSIIDLSPLGHQPMHYEHNGKKYTITFNGEIYNFQTERAELKKDGYVFKSKTDTEVIMALYDKYSMDFLKHLRGMFAFALYDHQKNKLICARDRLGKKPFKYYWDDNVFMFASELKSILTQPEYKKEIDYDAIHHYLTLQYCPAPMTGFKNIKKLKPAHYLVLDCANSTAQEEKYWQLDYTKKLKLTEREWEKEIIKGLEESVKLRMISDVPLGAFLSGGIDSSAIVALMAKNSSQPIKTFSIGFDKANHDETAYAQIIADKYKTDHTKLIVKPDAMKLLPKLVRQYEEPYADSSALPTFYLAEMTKKDVTVTLNGDGGDENFAGYGRYSVQKFGVWYDKVGPLHKLLAKPGAKLINTIFKTTFTNHAQTFSETLSKPYNKRYLSYIQYFSREAKHNLYTEKMLRKTSHLITSGIISNAFDTAPATNKIDQTVYIDIVTYLPDDLLVKVDIATMAHGLESRSPFLDHKFMEMTSQIPTNLKLKGLNNKKYILKKALEKDLVPKEILYRKKMGFGVPIEHWFRNEMKDYMYETLLSDKAISRGIFKEESVRELFDAHVDTKINHSYRIWALITLELWFQEFFDSH